MPEKCTVPTEHDCHIAMTVALLEKRVEDLEHSQTKEADFRAAYYEKQNCYIDRDARIDTKITEMDEKLDTLLEWQKAQQEKPIQRWDHLIEKSIWAVLASVITFLLARIGLS